ncbi:MAG: hypothetical protein HYS21_01265 [Deltaproteobacteria bacterium]|nr:hypothetical protein [Deltaproteobacteria bacterium]
MRIKNYFLVAASVMMLVVSGCSSEKKQESANPPATAEQGQGGGQGMPEGHPPTGGAPTDDMQKVAHANIKTQKTVVISDAIKAKYKEVKLEIVDNSTKAKEVATIKVGDTVQLTKDGYKLKVESFVPDYAIADNRIESRSAEPNNPAVLVELLQNDKSVAKGWIFRDFPEFNNYKNERFPLALVLPAAAKKAPAAPAKK